MDTILYQGPGYTIALTDQQSTMTHYPGMSPEEQALTGWTRGPFLDLVESPELIDSIPELAKSNALRAMVEAAVGSRSKLMTIGCDVGEFAGSDENGNRIHVGSYVSYAFRDFERASNKQQNVDLAGWMLNGVGAPPVGMEICYELIIEPLKGFYGHAGCYSVMAKAMGYGETMAECWRAHEWAAGALAASVARQREL